MQHLLPVREHSAGWIFVFVEPRVHLQKPPDDVSGLWLLAKVQESAMELPAGERAELLDWLWDTLQPQGVLELQERWAAGAEQRIEAVERGELTTVDGPTALAGLRRSLGAWPAASRRRH